METAFFNAQTIREIKIENRKLGGKKKVSSVFTQYVCSSFSFVVWNHSCFLFSTSPNSDAKESKEKDLRGKCARQISQEQDLWRTSIIDSIWLELRAYLNNGKSSEEQLNILKTEREQHEEVTRYY